MGSRLMPWFGQPIVPDQDQQTAVSSVRAIFATASSALDAMPESAEKTAGMRKLLEAKDCFIRAALGAQ